jgi:rod shape-determining protein MreD
VKAVSVMSALALALTLQTTLARFLPDGAAALDLVLVVVVYVALTNGPVTGMLAGSAAGLIQDVLSIDVIGIGGLAKSVVGFVVGAIGQQFIVTGALTRLVIFLGSSVAHAAMFIGLYVLLDLGSFPFSWAEIWSQAPGNTAVGMVVFSIVEVFSMVVDRRRMSKKMRR